MYEVQEVIDLIEQVAPPEPPQNGTIQVGKSTWAKKISTK